VVVAPSGTGKTLTSMNWLAEGGQFYGDDRLLYANGKIHCLTSAVNFWIHRYRSVPGDLRDEMVSLCLRDRLRSHFCNMVRRATLGRVGFSSSLSLARYWPDSVAEPAPLTRLVLLHRAERLSGIENADFAEAYNRVMADFRFQSLPVLRWCQCARIVLPESPLAQWEGACAKTLRAMLENVELLKIGVPPVYSASVYHSLREAIG